MGLISHPLLISSVSLQLVNLSHITSQVEVCILFRIALRVYKLVIRNPWACCGRSGNVSFLLVGLRNSPTQSFLGTLWPYYFCHLFSECILPKEMVPGDTLKNLAGLSIKKLMRPAN